MMVAPAVIIGAIVLVAHETVLCAPIRATGMHAFFTASSLLADN